MLWVHHPGNRSGGCLALAFVGITNAQTYDQAGPTADWSDAQTYDQAGPTADWSCVSVACVPDDSNTTPSRYDAVTNGFIRFQGTATGDLWFWCNVLSPLDTWGENPTWNAMLVTFRDSNRDGYVEVKLYRKRKDNGAYALNATYTSTDGAGVREEFVLIPAFDFSTYTYYLRIQLHRGATTGDPEFHIATLSDILL